MNEKKYMVLERNNILARGMRIDDALMFMQAYCEKYYMEVCELILKEEPRCMVEGEEE